MPVYSEHKSYTAFSPIWRKIRTVLAGEDTIKTQVLAQGGSAGYAIAYLPKPTGFRDHPRGADLWAEYVQRGEFFPASSRTVTGLLGSMFRRSPVVTLPRRYEAWKQSITQDGLSIEGFCKLVSKELLEIGRFGILVDMPAKPDANGNSAPAIHARASRPYLAGYAAEQIINWREAVVEDPDNPGVYAKVPTMVVLKECASKSEPGDMFCQEEIEQIRVLYLDDAGLYVCEVWQKDDDRPAASNNPNDGWIRTSASWPVGPNGKRLGFIPFVFVSPENQQSEIERSPIDDLVNLNLAHFTGACDLCWTAHMVACPTVYITGYQSKGTKQAIGPGVILEFEDPLVKLGILEFSGQGIQPLETRQEKTEDKLAKLGANLLRSKSKQPETAETTRIEHSAEASILAMIARNSGAAITLALGWAVWWDSGLKADTKTVSVQQNTEFYDARLTYQELNILMTGVQSGAIPLSVYCFNLIRGDMVKAGTSQEELEKEIADSLEENKPEPVIQQNAAGSGASNGEGVGRGISSLTSKASPSGESGSSGGNKAPGAPDLQ